MKVSGKFFEIWVSFKDTSKTKENFFSIITVFSFVIFH